VAQLWKRKTRTLGYGISNMNYESIYDKLNNISIHGNHSNGTLDIREETYSVYVSSESELPYVAKHYPKGTIILCRFDMYVVDENEQAILLASGENNLSCANDEEQPCHEIKKTTCDACGAHLPINNVNNNGICKCEYCDTFHYVW
jgi:hypothetical protein